MKAKRPTPGRQQRRVDTEARLVDAVGKLLRQRGVAGLGVNAVAEQAGVDKVLIYRYFGGLPELLRRYGESADFWPTLDEVLGPKREVLEHPDPARVIREILARFAKALRARPVTLDLLAWECVERNALTIVLEEVRERWSASLGAAVREAQPSMPPQVAALTALLGAAINYLSVRGRDLKVFGGLPIGTDRDWRMIEDVIEAAVRGLLNTPEG